MGRPVRTVVTVDEHTGEILNRSTVYVSPARSEPPYVKLYFEGAARLREMPAYCWAPLMWLMSRVPYANADPYIEIGSGTRGKMAEELEMSTVRVDHAMADMVRCGVLLRGKKSMYRFNPEFFARGEWKDIKRAREAN